jgi:hypothetical protein
MTDIALIVADDVFTTSTLGKIAALEGIAAIPRVARAQPRDREHLASRETATSTRPR